MINHITLITSTHLTSNPRLVKEAEALSEANFVVSVIFLQHIAELESFDEAIIETLPGIKFQSINFGRKNISSRFLNWKRLLRKAWIKINSKSNLSENLFFPEFKKLINKNHTDLYIGHTLQALPIVAWAAKQKKTKFAFDAEDYHRRETIDYRQNHFAEAFESKYLTDAVYISTASRFISDAYRKHFEMKKVITLNNFFPYHKLEPIKKLTDYEPVKMVWFSQTIGLNRGLKEFISKVVLLNPELFELHLRGTHDENIKSKLLTDLPTTWADKIFFHHQCPPQELILWLQNFDVGLALESNHPLNRDICITNKIFQYFSSGLAVIATPTTGQKWVIEQAADAGIIVLPEMDLDILKTWAINRPSLEDAKKAATTAAEYTFNWNIEKKKLIETIKQIRVE